MGALSKSSSMVDSPTVWELPDARPSPGGSGLRKVENMKTGRESLEAREDREDGYSSDASRRVYAEYQARSGIHASDTYGEGGRSTSLDSVTGRHTCRQVPDDARARGCNVEVTSTSFKSSRTGQVRREREQRERFNEGPMSLNMSSGTGCLGLGERQPGSGRQRDKSFELCVGTESMAPLASNLSDRRCQALAEAAACRSGNRPVVSAQSRTQRRYRGWQELYRDPATVGADRMARRTAYVQAARGLPLSLSPGIGLSLSQHVLETPVLEMIERHKKLASASVSGPL